MLNNYYMHKLIQDSELKNAIKKKAFYDLHVPRKAKRNFQLWERIRTILKRSSVPSETVNSKPPEMLSQSHSAVS